MSDSASKSDVEDVLSSVRRLVSTEVPRNRRPDMPKTTEALVLTDAQRVERPVSRGQAARSLEDRIAELEVAVSSRDDDYEPDGSEDQAQHTPDRIVYSRPPSNAEEAAARTSALRLSSLAVVPPAPEASEEADPTTDATPAPAFRHRASERGDIDKSAPEAEAPMAEDVAEEPRETAEVRPFHNPDDMIDRFEARMDGAEPPRPGPGHNGFSERLEPYRETPDAAETVDAAPEPAKAEAEPEDVLPDASAEAGADDVVDAEFEADLTEAVTRSVAAELSGAAPADATPEPAAAKDAADPEPEPAEGDVAEATPVAPIPLGADEEALRPIVAKLIRQELQGELGERITRNVRKLVRREILRVINAREFE